MNLSIYNEMDKINAGTAFHSTAIPSVPYLLIIGTGNYFFGISHHQLAYTPPLYYSEPDEGHYTNL